MTEFFPEDDDRLPSIIWDDLVSPPDEELPEEEMSQGPAFLTDRHFAFMEDRSLLGVPMRIGFSTVSQTDERILPAQRRDSTDPIPTLVDGDVVYFAENPKDFALESDIAMQDRADIFTANWLMRTGQVGAGYTLLCGVKTLMPAEFYYINLLSILE